MGAVACILDGDEIRKGLNSDLGFSAEDRVENNRRVAEAARLIADAGIVAIVAVISPIQEARHTARKIIGKSGIHFIEVFVDTPLEVCEMRDSKGHYRRAREGRLANFTGVSADYERPLSPDIVVHPGEESLETSVATVFRALPAFQ